MLIILIYIYFEITMFQYCSLVMSQCGDLQSHISWCIFQFNGKKRAWNIVNSFVLNKPTDTGEHVL